MSTLSGMSAHGTTPNEFFPHLTEKLNDETLSDEEFRKFVRESTEGMHKQPELQLSPFGFDGHISGPQTALSWISQKMKWSDC
jgi:hypothetical protein